MLKENSHYNLSPYNSLPSFGERFGKTYKSGLISAGKRFNFLSIHAAGEQQQKDVKDKGKKFFFFKIDKKNPQINQINFIT